MQADTGHNHVVAMIGAQMQEYHQRGANYRHELSLPLMAWIVVQ